ncbi:MAG TPA: hypothetical protein VGC08_03020 [Pedobacter sp.]
MKQSFPALIKSKKNSITSIEEDIWGGAGCIILKGVNISKSRVVGAGTPARKIGERKELCD